MFLCGLFRAGQLPQRLQGKREGKEEQERHAGWAQEGPCCVVSWLWRAINLRGGQGIPSCPLMTLNRFSRQLTSGHLPLLDACRGFCPLPDIPPTHGQTLPALYDSCQVSLLPHMLPPASPDWSCFSSFLPGICGLSLPKYLLVFSLRA